MTILTLAGVAVLGLVAWKAYGAAGDAAAAVGEKVSAAAQAVNPLNPDNVFASSVNSVGETITGQSDWSLGGWLYDTTHADPVKQATGGATGGW